MRIISLPASATLMTPNPKTDGAAPHLVAKIGGSLWRSPLLGAWIAALRRFPHPLTVIPGGGPFADAVRAAQPVMGFSTLAAHGMALLAMEQYALALADVHAGLALVSTPREADRVHARGGVALWRPFAMVRGASDIAASWDVTSDSLAAWYARQAGASALLLIKSVDMEPTPLESDTSHGGSNPITIASSSGDIVDPCFCGFSQGLTVFIVGPKALSGAAAVFSAGGVPGTRLDLAHLNQKIAS